MLQPENIHLVLVEPEDNLNIGSVARAMMNLDFSQLILVAPRKYRPRKAAVTACWATDILEGAKIYDKLEDALACMQEVVGFTARSGKNRTGFKSLQQYCTDLSSKNSENIALLFGPEDTGLRQEHLEHCRYLISIPSSEKCPAYNLAQAALLALFEINKSIGAQGNARELSEPGAEWSNFYQLDRLIDSVLSESGFLNSGTPAQLPGVIKSLFRRTNPSRREMQILLGLFERIEGSLRGRYGLSQVKRAV